MKNLLFVLCFFVAGANSSLFAQDAVLAIHTPVKAEAAVSKLAIDWDQTTFEFGKISQDVPAQATFVLTNKGDQPLLLTEVKPTCGCTIAEYTQEPILPGQTAKITTTYNAKKKGVFRKTIKVMTNQSDTMIPLTLKGEVVAE